MCVHFVSLYPVNDSGLSVINVFVSVCSGISCMAQDCSLQMPEDFVLPLLPGEELKDKYRRYLFRDYVEVCVCLSVCICAESVYSDAASRSACTAHDTSEACGKGVRREKNSISPCVFESLTLLHAALNLNAVSRFQSHQLGFNLDIFMQIMISQFRDWYFS